MLIGAHVVAATDIYFYVRDEYQAALVVLRRELDKLKAAGLTDGLTHPSPPRCRRLYLR